MAVPCRSPPVEDAVFPHQAALNAAASKGDVASVASILDVCRHPQLSLRDAFAAALAQGQLDLARLLAFDVRLDRGAIGDALQAAAGRVVAVTFLDAAALRTGPWTVRDAAFYRYDHVPEYLLSCAGADPSAGDSYCLRQAAANGDARVVALLLGDGRADPNALNGSALRLAARLGHVAVVRLLLGDGRADPALADSEALRSASEHGHDAIVAALLAHGGSDVGARRSEALVRAASNGHAAVVAGLIAAGACPTAEAVRSALGQHRYRALRVLVEDERGGDRRLLAQARAALDRARRREIASMVLVRKADLLGPVPADVQTVVLQMAFGALMDDAGEVRAVLERIDERNRSRRRGPTINNRL